MDIERGTEISRARHETRDASIRGLAIFGACLFVTLIVVLFAVKGMFNYFKATQSLGPPASPFENARQVPPQPRLQVNPRQDLRQFREAEDERLNSYAWVDEKAGVVRIPIGRAMDLLAQRGLPVRSKPAKQGTSSGQRF